MVSSLDGLLRLAVETFLDDQRTPTLVLPSHVRLRASFYVALADAWQRRLESLAGSAMSRPVALKRLLLQRCAAPRSISGAITLAEPIASLRSTWAQRTVRRRVDTGTFRIERCLMPRRPASDSQELVLAIATPSTELPPWAAPIEF